jgi:hypothetical protein
MTIICKDIQYGVSKKSYNPYCILAFNSQIEVKEIRSDREIYEEVLYMNHTRKQIIYFSNNLLFEDTYYNTSIFHITGNVMKIKQLVLKLTYEFPIDLISMCEFTLF